MVLRFRVFFFVTVALSGVVPAAVAQPAASTATFNKDVAPILFSQCAACHRPGGSASSTLLTFDDARRRARQIASVTASRTMPPWKPEPGFGDFEGNRRLTDGQIAVFQRWLDDGLQEGDRRDLPKLPSWPADWELGPPDLIVTMPEYTLRAGGPDMGESGIILSPGAVGNAIFNAIGKRMKDLPITRDKILGALA